MNRLTFIPIGSEVYSDGKYLATTVVRFEDGYIPKSSDFEPEISSGTVWFNFVFRFGGVDIYKHPNFLDASEIDTYPYCLIEYDQDTVKGCNFCEQSKYSNERY